MGSRKVSELPANPYRDILAEAERRGVECLLGNDEKLDAEAVIFAGMADIINELREEIAAMREFLSLSVL